MEYQPGLLKFHSSDCRTEDAKHEQTADEKMRMTRLNEPFRPGTIAADGSSLPTVQTQGFCFYTWK